MQLAGSVVGHYGQYGVSCVSSPLTWQAALAQFRPNAGAFGQILQGSFSTVSKPNFASKYALESSRRDLHNALLRTALKSHFF